MKETEVAEKVIEYMKNDGWEVFKEVYEPFNMYRRIDIVCKKHNILWAIECKSSINFKILMQGAKGKTYCHFASIAVPVVKDHDANSFTRQYCEERGIGMFVIDEYTVKRGTGMIGIDEYSVNCKVYPKYNRRNLSEYLLPNLHETYKSTDVIAGSRDSFWSPYRQTIQNIVAILKKHGRLTKAELWEKLAGNHHWQGDSAKHTMAAQILKHEKDIIKTEKVGKVLYFDLLTK